MSNYYNTVNKNPIVIKTIKPTLGLEKTKEFKKKLEDKKKGRKALKGGSDLKEVVDKKTNKMVFVTTKELAKNTDKYSPPSKVEKKAKGGRVGLKGGSDFPDYSGDGKTTMKDILMARGVIPKPKDKKKKMMAKKSKTPMDKAVKKDKKNKRFV